MRASLLDLQAPALCGECRKVLLKVLKERSPKTKSPDALVRSIRAFAYDLAVSRQGLSVTTRGVIPSDAVSPIGVARTDAARKFDQAIPEYRIGGGRRGIQRSCSHLRIKRLRHRARRSNERSQAERIAPVLLDLLVQYGFHDVLLSA